MAKAPAVPIDRLSVLLNRARESNPDATYVLAFSDSKDAEGVPIWVTDVAEERLAERAPGTYQVVNEDDWEPIARASIAERREHKGGRPSAAEAAATAISEAWAGANADLKETIKELKGELRVLRAERDDLKEQVAAHIAGQDDDDFPKELVVLAREAMHMFGGKHAKKEIIARFNRLAPKLRSIIGDENLLAVAELLKEELDRPPPQLTQGDESDDEEGDDE